MYMAKKELTFSSKVLLTLLAAYGAVNDILSLRDTMRRMPGGISYKDKSAEIMLRRLYNKGWIKVVDKEGEKFLKLTKAGQLQALLAKARFPIKETWDGKWRIILFDIPESANDKRDFLRTLLKRNNFIKLQGSVYINPYPLNREAVTYLKQTGLIEFIRIIKVEEMDDDEDLRKRFGLEKGNKNSRP